MTSRGDLGCLLMEILVASSWRSWLPSHCLLVENYCILVDNFTFLRISYVMIGLLAFLLSLRGLVTTFLLSFLRRFCRLLDWSPWTNISWWCQRNGRTSFPTIQTDFVDLRKLVVTFHLLRLRAFTCCNLYRSTSLLSFSNVTVGLLLYLIL